MAMPGDTVSVSVVLSHAIAMETGQRFAIREGGKTIGAGQVLGPQVAGRVRAQAFTRFTSSDHCQQSCTGVTNRPQA